MLGEDPIQYSDDYAALFRTLCLDDVFMLDRTTASRGKGAGIDAIVHVR
jgi:hypothetical protein